MTVPQVSRRGFAAALSGLAALVGLRARPLTARTLEITVKQVPLLSREELEQELIHVYNRWMRVPAQIRSAESLRQQAGEILATQWILRNGPKRVRDSILHSRSEGHVAGVINSCGFMSNTLHFGEIKPAPKKVEPGAFDPNLAVPGGVRVVGIHDPFTIQDRSVIPAKFSVMDRYHASWHIGYCSVWEGSPAERFGIGLALSFVSLCRAVEEDRLDWVGEVHVEATQFQQTLQISLWSPALQMPVVEEKPPLSHVWGEGWMNPGPVTMECGKGRR